MADIYEIKEKFDSLRGETANRLSKYAESLDWYKGDHELYMSSKEGRPTHKTNLCSRAVRMLANFTFSQMFDIHAKRPSEVKTKVEEEPVPFQEELNLSEIQEKVIRRIFNFNQQGKLELTQGMESGLAIGDTCLFLYWDDDNNIPRIQSIFPGHVRIKYKSGNYEQPEDAFVVQVVSVKEIKKKFGIDVPPVKSDEVDISAIWDSELLLSEKYTLFITHYDDRFKTRYAGNILIDQETHNLPGIPLMVIPAFRIPFSPWGGSIIDEIKTINKEYNEGISDEAAIARIFAHPKVIIRNATQKDIENIKANWKSGIVASRTNLEVTPFQFTGQLFPIEQRISKIEERFFRQSGLGPAVFGMPPGSINTGASLTVQYAPTLQQAQIIWSSWEPKLLKLIDYIVDLLKVHGTDPDSKIAYSKIFKDKPQWMLKAPFRMPRDEAIVIANEIQKYSQGLQSRTRTMTNIGIESPEDEMTLRTWEDIVLAQLLPQQVQTPAARSPMAGAEAGGQIRAAQATMGAAMGAAPMPAEIAPGGRGTRRL